METLEAGTATEEQVHYLVDTLRRFNRDFTAGCVLEAYRTGKDLQNWLTWGVEDLNEACNN